jgi:hypothetical protein
MRGDAWTDAEMLRLLDLVERQGLSDLRAAKVMTLEGHRRFTKGAVIGMRSRINAETRAIPDLCDKPENRDGGMPSGWWRAGLDYQGVA